MKEQNAPFSLDTIAFLFRRPWLFIFPFVIITNIVVAYLNYQPVVYNSSATVSFETGEAPVFDKKLIQQKKDLISNIFLGRGIYEVVHEVWPKVSEETNPKKFNELVSRLRARNGIQVKYDDPDYPSFLTISFMSGEPQVCYKVVQAVIDKIINENKKISGKEIEASLAFLRKQVNFYKGKLQEIDRGMSRIKSELREKSSTLSDSEKILVDDVIENNNLPEEDNPAMQKFIKYDEILTEFNLQLLETQKAKESMVGRLKTGKFEIEPLSAENINNDTIIKEYSQAIAEKKLDLTQFVSKGYLPEHPDIKRLEREIKDLKELKEGRIKELTSSIPFNLEEMKKAKEKILRDELEKSEFQIETLEEKINLIKGYKEKAEEELKRRAPESSEIFDKVSELIELRNEKEINMGYYFELRKELEQEELKSRIEKEEAGFKIEVIEPAKVPLEPIPFQRVTKIFMGLIFAVAAGGGLSYVADMLDNSVKSTAELRELLTLPILATINKLNSPEDIKSKRLKNNAIAVALAITIVISHLGVKIAMKLF